MTMQTLLNKHTPAKIIKWALPLAALMLTAGRFSTDTDIRDDVQLPAGGGITEISLDGESLKVERDGVILSNRTVISDISLAVNGTPHEDDTFKVRVSPMLRGTVRVDGGDGGYDILEIAGDGHAARIVANYYNKHDGSLKFDYEGDGNFDLTLEYRGLEPISSSINATDVTLNFTGSSETITVTDGGSGQTTVESTLGESTTFNNPTNSLTINAGNGADQININSFSSSFAADLIIDGEANADNLNINVDLDIGSHTLTITAETTVSTNANVSLTCATLNLNSALSVSGAVTIDAPTLSTTAAITSTGGGTLTLYCNTLALGGALTSSGMLFIQPSSGAPTIGVGGGTGTLNLDDTEIAYFTDGFSQIVIGDGSSGDMDIATATFTDNVALQSGGSIHDGSGTDVTAPAASFFGTAAPGQSPGILQVSGNFAFGEGSEFAAEIGGTTPGTAAGNHDQISVTGTVTIPTPAYITTSAYGGFTPTNGDQFTIIDNDATDAVSGTFTGLAEGAVISNFLGSGMPASISYVGGDGNDVVITVDTSLPVELHSFSACYGNGAVTVSWITESETDNLGFILDRSCNAGWQRVGSYQSHPELAGQGSSSEQHQYSYTDEDVEASHTYVYRLSDVNTEGRVRVYDVIEITLPGTPAETVLKAPFPNPFNPMTRVSYELAESGPVEITVYDLLGRKVRTLVQAERPAGSFNIYWRGDDDSGSKVATGSYVIVLKTGEVLKTQKTVFTK